MDLGIFIPSRGRSHWKVLPVLEELKNKLSLKIPTMLIVPSSEQGAYSKFKDLYNCQVIGIDAQGIGPVRDEILEMAESFGFATAIMFDDDIKFSKRVSYDPIKLSRKEPIDELFEWIQEKVDLGYIHGGVSPRQANNYMKDSERLYVRCNNVHWFDVKEVLEKGIKFSTLKVMEDFYMTISLLLKGYPNVSTYTYAWDQQGSGLEGGCSLYRDLDMQAEAAKELSHRFPRYVHLQYKSKPTSAHGSVFAEERTDVRIMWKKIQKDVEYGLAEGETL